MALHGFPMLPRHLLHGNYLHRTLLALVCLLPHWFLLENVSASLPCASALITAFPQPLSPGLVEFCGTLSQCELHDHITYAFEVAWRVFDSS
eukprot:1502730-Rhodomonas_salina.1